MNQTEIAFILVMVLVLGLNTIIWGTAGLARIAATGMNSLQTRYDVRRGLVRVPAEQSIVRRRDVAILIAAHNEETVIAKTLHSAGAQVPMNHVFVISDGSHDNTARMAMDAGANVLELNPNRGKAGALVAGIEHFDLAGAFEVVVLLDADTVLSDDYLQTGLPLFTDDGVVAVAGRATTLVVPGARSALGRVLVAYRERVYVVVQLLIKFGQAARPADVVSIVPGFASMYRTGILSHVDIAAAGLTIEDYNMTFEIHAKKLGRIAFHPGAAVAFTQDPDNFHDYLKQVGRWSLGFWQTVLRHPFQPRKFWFALYLYVAELVVSSVLVLLLVPMIIVSALSSVFASAGWDGTIGGVSVGVGIPVYVLVLGFVIPDYLLTILTAAATRRPVYLLLGFAFPLLRIVDAAVCLHRLPEAIIGESNGVWTSPSRRGAELVSEQVPTTGSALAAQGRRRGDEL
ncbi:glycosyltransferase family 2 protein [Subtercola sp. PAMC28395]|uniref:glycosyltransferase family 2 protein n=1 Tax=Subtercola sp. PAMC28395 TaxID=2846775 RepID=UPI001C0D830C|nr:glycosyltransferase family 2 protein [Subtercola sp. PAMC28395]QWT23393.1 glycosyltransferase family 2 protein [Subtercola sp. PAMC28395]